MRLKYSFGLLLCVVVISGMISCTRLSEADSERFRILGESLEISNKREQSNSERVLESIKEKANEPVTMVRAELWFPRAKKIYFYLKGMVEYINGLSGNEKISKNESDSLFQKLIQFRENCFAVDLAIDSAFRNYFYPSGYFPDNPDSFYSKYFKGADKISAIAMLRGLGQMVLRSTTGVLHFCNEQIGTEYRDFTSYSAIVGQNKSQLVSEQLLEITAGVGAFTSMANPRIMVGDSLVEIGEDGAVHYKARVPSAPGNYSVPVKISFMDEYGKQQTISKDVEYKVVKPQ